MNRTELSALQAVVAVATRSSFRAAAAELGLSPSAVSHAVSGLEERMGVRLFHRTTRSVSLSEAGRSFLARIEPALKEIDGAIDATAALSPKPTGTLRINTSETAAHQLLGRYVGRYLKCYPEMRVDIVTEGRLVDIVADGFDAGVRLSSSVPQDMVAAHFGPEQGFAVLGSPAYFKSHGIPRTPHDLKAHRCIRNRLPSGAMWRWEFKKHDEEISPPSLGRLALYYPGHRHVPAGLRAFIEVVREIDSTSQQR